MRVLTILGAALDIIVALFLLLVAGWVIDAWHDPRMPWAGLFVTIPWAIAFILTAGAPPFAYWRSKKGATAQRIALLVWTPAAMFVLVCVVGLLLSPP